MSGIASARRVGRRLRLYDLVVLAIFVVALVGLWSERSNVRPLQGVEGGYSRSISAELVLAITDPSVVRLARDLELGALDAAATSDLQRMQLSDMSDGPGGSLLLTLRSTIEVDEAGRWSWQRQRLRRGGDLVLTTPDAILSGILYAVRVAES